jgi:hypothetical protein
MVKTNPRRRRNKEPTSGGGFRNILAVLATTTPACDNSYADGASGEPNHRGLKRKAAGAATGSCAAADGLSLRSVAHRSFGAANDERRGDNSSQQTHPSHLDCNPQHIPPPITHGS